MTGTEDADTCVVVVNHEGQYSIWPEARPLPGGWRAGGQTGTRAACLEFIESAWTDMTPASLRRPTER
ncbi:MAG: MbtH family NRPS accessory protein [Vicinamibacteria bacterium]